jgi:hypothetical protein
VTACATTPETTARRSSSGVQEKNPRGRPRPAVIIRQLQLYWCTPGCGSYRSSVGRKCPRVVRVYLILKAVVTRQPRGTDGVPSRGEPDSVGILTINTSTLAIAQCNEAFAELVGLRVIDMVDCPVADFVDDDVSAVATAVFDGIRAGWIDSVEGNIQSLGPLGLRRDRMLDSRPRHRPAPRIRHSRSPPRHSWHVSPRRALRYRPDSNYFRDLGQGVAHQRNPPGIHGSARIAATQFHVGDAAASRAGSPRRRPFARCAGRSLFEGGT